MIYTSRHKFREALGDENDVLWVGEILNGLNASLGSIFYRPRNRDHVLVFSSRWAEQESGKPPVITILRLKIGWLDRQFYECATITKIPRNRLKLMLKDWNVVWVVEHDIRSYLERHYQ